MVVSRLPKVTEEGTEVIMRRFGDRPLTGRDLSTIRNDVVRMTQAELADEWGMSRTFVSRVENQDKPERRVTDMYLGLLMRRFFFNRNS